MGSGRVLFGQATVIARESFVHFQFVGLTWEEIQNTGSRGQVDGEPREFSLPKGARAVISVYDYVDEIAFPIGPVAFPEPGLYEYQLWVEGMTEPIARERVMARE